MGSEESHFDVSVIVRDKVTRPCPQTTTFSKREESREPYGGGGEEGDYQYTYRYTVTTRMTSALRWAVILMFHNYEGQSQKTVSTDHNF